MKTINLLATTLFCLLTFGCAQHSDHKPADNAPPADHSVVCPQDAMQCPDGSWVGRSGPNCEFVCE